MTVRRGYADTPFGQVHYRTAGTRTDALPLVLFHQTASSSVMYEALMAELAAEVWMFAPDTPGFGGTEAPAERGSIAVYTRTLHAAMQAMEIDRCLVFGHHTGANIAVHLATDAPHVVHRLILSGPPLLTKPQIETLLPTVSPVTLFEDGRHLAAVWARIRKKDPEAPTALSHREAVLNLHAGVRYPEAYDAVFEHDFGERLEQIACPTLVMAGARDTIRSALERAHARIPGAELRALPRGSTYICDTEPALVAGVIRDFLLEGP